MKKFKAKRIPTLLVVVPLWILTMLVILGIYIIISVSGASIKKTLTTGLSISDGQELGKIVKAKKKANDGVRRVFDRSSIVFKFILRSLYTMYIIPLFFLSNI